MLPWKYPESFLIAFALFLASLGIENFTGSKVPPITWPLNIIFLVLLALVSLLLFRLSIRKPAFKWFYSVHASIAAVIFFVVPSLFMALIPQNKTTSPSFLYDVSSSWTYAIGVLFFLIVLGTVTVKRLSSLSRVNVGFIINHLGLWLCVATAHLGAGDIQKLNMFLEEGKTVWYGFNQKDQVHELDFAIKLRDFSIEEYPAKIAIVDNSTGSIIKSNHKSFMFDPSEGMNFNYGVNQFKIHKLLTSSAPVQNRFEPILAMGATQSLQIIKSSRELIDTFWISSPSILYRQEIFPVDSNTAMVMLKPEPRRFLSEISVYEKTGANYDTIIEVNKPIEISNWKIYQTSYDESMGKWSTKSTFELIKDPWLPFVYIGFFMLIIGSLFMIWNGKKSVGKENDQEPMDALENN